MTETIRLIVTDEIRAVATVVHKRRTLSGSKQSYLYTLGETAVMSHYGRTIQLDDLTPGYNELSLIVTDNNDQRVRFVAISKWPSRVYSRQLDADIYVFAEAEDTSNVLLYGWLPIEQVEQAPIEWFTKNGKRVSYAHNIEQPFINEPPDTFNFAGCPHFDQFGGIWHSGYEGWLCAGCGHLVYDAYQRDDFPDIYAAWEERRRQRNSSGPMEETTERTKS